MEAASSLSSSISERDRYEIEFEFVQNLANVGYLQFLAQEKYLEDEAFLRFLEYLRYWKQPEYLVQLRFPQCLAFLDALIDNAEFRKEISKMEVRDFAHQQQAKHWMLGPKIYSSHDEKRYDGGNVISNNTADGNVSIEDRMDESL